MKKICTLGYLHRGDMVCLAMKKTGFGSGRVNGYGGKKEPDETFIDCLVREVYEEAHVHIQPQDCEKVGSLYFKVVDNEDWKETEVHVYRIYHFSGTPIETDEMKPEWFSKDEVPYESMWISDQKWFPYYLANKKFVGHFTLSEVNELMSWNIEEVFEF